MNAPNSDSTYSAAPVLMVAYDKNNVREKYFI